MPDNVWWQVMAVNPPRFADFYYIFLLHQSCVLCSTVKVGCSWPEIYLTGFMVQSLWMFWGKDCFNMICNMLCTDKVEQSLSFIHSGTLILETWDEHGDAMQQWAGSWFSTLQFFYQTENKTFGTYTTCYSVWTFFILTKIDIYIVYYYLLHSFGWDYSTPAFPIILLLWILF